MPQTEQKWAFSVLSHDFGYAFVWGGGGGYWIPGFSNLKKKLSTIFDLISFKDTPIIRLLLLISSHGASANNARSLSCLSHGVSTLLFWTFDRAVKWLWGVVVPLHSIIIRKVKPDQRISAQVTRSRLTISDHVVLWRHARHLSTFFRPFKPM